MYQAGLEIIIMASGFALTKKRLVKGINSHGKVYGVGFSGEEYEADWCGEVALDVVLYALYAVL